jgi:hypothetical protein
MARAIAFQRRQKLGQNLVAKKRTARSDEEEAGVGDDTAEPLGRLAILRQDDEAADLGGAVVRIADAQ